MLKKSDRLFWWFGGVTLVPALLFLGWIFVARPSFCEPTTDKWTAHGYQYSTPDNYRSEQWGNISIEKKKPSYRPDNGSHNKYTENFWEVVCGELKITDLAVAFFTYCLVVVGWFTMRSTDESTKNAERAYLIAGPLFGIPKKIPEDEIGKWEMKNRALKSMFRGPYRMAITNFGRTSAYSTKMEWGLCTLDEFKRAIKGLNEKSAVSDLLDSTHPELIKWKHKHLKPVSEIQNVFSPTNEPLQLRLVEVSEEERTKYAGGVFFGRITYMDVFKEEHYTTFSYHMVPEHSDSIGKSLSHDHS